jgi:hypothetical protein
VSNRFILKTVFFPVQTVQLSTCRVRVFKTHVSFQGSR